MSARGRPLPTSGAQLHECVGGVRFSRFPAPVAPCCASRPIRLGVEPVHEAHAHLGREPEPARDHPEVVDPVSHRPRPVLFGVQLLTIDGTQRDTPRLLAQTSEPARRRHLQQRALRARDRRLSRDDLARLGERHLAGRERLTRGGTLCRGSDRRERGARFSRRAANSARHPLRAVAEAASPMRIARDRALARPDPRRRARLLQQRELLGDRRAVVARPESGIEAAQQLLQLTSKRTKTCHDPPPEPTGLGRRVIDAGPSKRPLRLPERTFAVNAQISRPASPVESYSNASTRSPCNQVSHW